ncbi:hypothetical protein QOZ98_002248 [Planomicrobium stackebrandtii]|uniref:Uncharacterized protein n=1 Tax=Planomicrobium stackebrandtii TaxID=253160 RepID=A0ABU0GVN4_9BACL|nr:hypothetical protein [Planomicrobium stackebrandtii]MDQ0429420.1 hypothetical protein [Planomicrobium stackebrandtii]
MVAHIILGINIDTPFWISILKKQGIKNIFIFNYESQNNAELESYKDVTYIHQELAEKILQDFTDVVFYKSLYAFPGMNGQMSTLYKS